MGDKKNNFIPAVAVIVGTCIGAGVLGIPYVASESGFLIALLYIFALGGIILLLNLYLGEICLRTKSDHQIAGYAEKYLGKKAKKIMEFSLIFGIYSAIIAYMFGVGESISFLIFQNFNYTPLFGVLFGLLMSSMVYKGLSALKKYEKFGVGVVLILILAILLVFSTKIDYNNLSSINLSNFLVPFGVVLFALHSFAAVPEAKLMLRNEKKKMKKTLIVSSIISIVAYVIFTFVVVGFLGNRTPEVATLALGPIFIFLGIFTMTTSHLSLGNALLENFMFDNGYKKIKAWFIASVVPILIFIVISFWNFFSFTQILSIGGVVTGGITAVIILLTAKKAKILGDKKPEYEIPINWFVIGSLILVFLVGVIREIFATIKVI